MTTRILLLFSTIILLFSCSKPIAPIAPLPDLKNKKVLIVWGGWDGHQPDKYAQRMEKWLKEEGANVTVSDSLGIYCLLYTSPSPRDATLSRMPSSA